MNAGGYRKLLVLALRTIGVAGFVAAGVALVACLVLVGLGGATLLAPELDPDAPVAFAWLSLLVLGGGAAVVAVVAAIVVLALAEILDLLSRNDSAARE